MSTTLGCGPGCCEDTVVVNTPGSAGGNAYTTTTASFVIPAIAATVVVSVGSTAWMAVGQKIFISDTAVQGTFEVQSINSSVSVTLVFMGYTDDSAPGGSISFTAAVSPSGVQQSITLPLPIADGGTGQATAALAFAALYAGSQLPIANGGTSGTSKATAIAALGVGQNATADNNTGLAYDITNAAAQITGVSATAASTGLYRVEACVSVDYTGTTFASSRVLTITLRNATAGTNILSVTRNTGIHTTTTQPTIDYFIFATSSLTAADAIQVFISLDTVESAGSSVVSSCNLLLTPIAI